MDENEVHVGGVRVVNKNDFEIVDRFDGVPFTFEPNKPVTIPPDAANHIFGWAHGATEDEMLVYCQKRHGWNTPQAIKAGDHLKFFHNIEMKPVRFRMVEVAEDEDSLPTIAEPPRAPRKQTGNKLMQAANEAEARRAGS